MIVMETAYVLRQGSTYRISLNRKIYQGDKPGREMTLYLRCRKPRVWIEEQRSPHPGPQRVEVQVGCPGLLVLGAEEEAQALAWPGLALLLTGVIRHRERHPPPQGTATRLMQ